MRLRIADLQTTVHRLQSTISNDMFSIRNQVIRNQ
jgi:hypothetical protein